MQRCVIAQQGKVIDRDKVSSYYAVNRMLGDGLPVMCSKIGHVRFRYTFIFFSFANRVERLIPRETAARE